MKYRIYHKILKVTIMCSLAAPFIHGAVQEKINAALVAIDAQVNNLYGAVSGSKAVIEGLINENRMLKQQLAQKPQQTPQDAQVNQLYAAVAKSKVVIEGLIKENTMLKQQLAQKTQQTPQVTATNPSIIMQQNEKLRLELQQFSSSNKALLQEKQRWIEDRGKIIKDGQALVARYQQALEKAQLSSQSRR